MCIAWVQLVKRVLSALAVVQWMLLVFHLNRLESNGKYMHQTCGVDWRLWHLHLDRGEQIRCARNSILYNFDVFRWQRQRVAVKCGWQNVRERCCYKLIRVNDILCVGKEQGAHTSAPKTLWSTNAYNKQHAEIEQVSSCVTRTKRGWCLGTRLGELCKQMAFSEIFQFWAREFESRWWAVCVCVCLFSNMLNVVVYWRVIRSVETWML